MLKLVLNIIFFVALAVFTAMNVSSTTDLNLFTWKITDVSVVAVILISIAVGILYSFIYYLGSYVAKRGKEKFKKNKTKAMAKEKELDEREKIIKQTVDNIPQTLITRQEEQLNELPIDRTPKKPRFGRKAKEIAEPVSPDQSLEDLPDFTSPADTAHPKEKKKKFFK